ncbi:hypothetical protein DFH09DRAFT_1504243 [Mycena vulgaris]|nr:hypothetical protein DFH09DRAFT_1504243 [Mycena vulgaris]
MKAIGGRRLGRRGGHNSSGSRLATNVPKYTVTFHTNTTAPESHERYVANAESGPQPTFLDFPADVPQEDAPSLPLLFGALDEPAGAVPAYEMTTACNKEAAKKRQNVAHMDELKAEEAVFLRMLLGLHHHSQLLTPCACGVESCLRKVACRDCVQPELLCRQCWVNKHRTMPTHWAFIWNAQDRFFEKSEFCRVLKNSAVALGHYGERCADAAPARTFTLVESNGIHATAIRFCGCKTVKTVDGMHPAPDFQQLLGAGIFPGSVKEPKTGYTLGVLEAYREERNQGKGSAYDFVRVLQRKADPFFAGAVPVVMRRGQGHGMDVPLPGELDCPYPNRPVGFLGLNCAACPERGVNMPLLVNVPKYLRHLVSQHFTLDGKFKANLFFKRDNGSDRALTDGNMYFPRQEEFNKIAKEYVVPDEDKEVPCNSHIGLIRNQGTKYGNTAISGVIAGACDHAVAGSFIDIPKGEAFALGTYATRELLRHTNSPPQPRECRGSLVGSYDSYCACEVNQLKRAVLLFPEDTWLHELLETIEGQIPADHINGHGPDCQCFWQPVYFACRAHFHGETAEMLWAFLNPLGASKHQMTAGGRHNIISFVMDAWNMWKVLRQAELLAAERLDALKLFELHMVVVVDLSRQHATEVAAWSRLSRLTTRARGKKPRSVYQHESTKVLTLDHMLASMLAEERENATRERAQEPSAAGTLAGKIPTYIGQRGTRASSMEQLAASAPLSPNDREQESEENDPRLLMGTQTLKRSGHMLKSPRVYKRLKDIAPDDVLVEPVLSEAEDSDELEASPSKLAKERRGKGKGKPKKSDGWIWLEKVTRGQTLGDESKLAEYKAESDRVQWFRAEAEMYRWLEAYERKHAELMRVEARFSRDNVVWTGLADREEANNGRNGAVSFARMHAAMYMRLAHNAKVIFKSADSGAHHDWATATTLDELVIKVDRWRDVVFKWMDDMGIHRAYKDF